MERIDRPRSSRVRSAAQLASLAFAIPAFAIPALAIASVGCIVVARRPPRAEVAYPPPAPAYEPPVFCDAGYAHVAGHWRWNGYQYSWVPQRCVYRPGYRWQPGSYYPCGEGYCYREGVWIGVSGGVIVR